MGTTEPVCIQVSFENTRSGDYDSQNRTCHYSDMAYRDSESRFLDELRQAKTSGRAVAIYASTDSEGQYEVALIEHVDEENVALMCLTREGLPNGRRYLELSAIDRIDMDNAYLRKLELLHQYSDTVLEKTFRPGPSDGALVTQLRHAMDTNTLIEISDKDDYVLNGFVRYVGDDYVQVERVTKQGMPDGESIIRFEAIETVHIGQRSDQILEFLYRYNVDLKRLLGA